MKEKCGWIFIVIIVFLTGCTQKDMITVCEFEPFKFTIAEKQVDKLFYTEVYHNNKIVHKEIITEVYIADKDSVDELQLVIDGFERAFSNDIFNYDGISYDYELDNTTLTTQVIIDYTILDLSNINENLLTYIGGPDVLDEKNNLLYEQVIDVRTKAGFNCEQFENSCKENSQSEVNNNTMVDSFKIEKIESNALAVILNNPTEEQLEKINNLKTFEYENSKESLLIIPLYNHSNIKIEKLKFDDNNLSADGIVYEEDSTIDGFGLLLKATRTEGIPLLKICINYKDTHAEYLLNSSGYEAMPSIEFITKN